MEYIPLIMLILAIGGIAVKLIGWERVRQRLPWVEKEPYVVALRYKLLPEDDPVIGEIFRAARDAGRNPQWFPVGSEQTQMREGLEPLRPQDGRRVVFQSKTLAHADELVMMALRASAKK